MISPEQPYKYDGDDDDDNGEQDDDNEEIDEGHQL